MKVNILHCVDGAKEARGITVIIDVFRAFSVEAYLSFLGAKEIHPVGDDKFPLEYKKNNPDVVIIGERYGIKLDGYDFGNSPTEIMNGDIIEVGFLRDEILACMETVAEIFVDDTVISYMLDLINATRNDDKILAGISTRGSIALYKVAQSYAAIKGRDFVTPEDIKLFALPVFRKRLILKGEALVKGYTAEGVIKDLLQTIPVPTYKAHV